eukprot:6457217-Amphidinium_carterae.1
MGYMTTTAARRYSATTWTPHWSSNLEVLLPQCQSQKPAPLWVPTLMVPAGFGGSSPLTAAHRLLQESAANASRG